MTAHRANAGDPGATLDDAVLEILSGPDGPIPALLRDHLVGLMNALATRLYGGAASPTDPAAEQLLDAVRARLRERPAERRAPRTDPAQVITTLVQTLLEDAEARSVVGRPRPGSDPAQLWEWLHLSLRALAADSHVRFRRLALDAFGLTDDTLPVPACPPVGHPGWSGVREFLAKLGSQLPEPVFAELKPMVIPLAEVLAMVGRADDLHTGHSAYPARRLTPLRSPEERARFVTMALDYVRALHEDGNVVRDIARLIPCDELVRSLVPVPLPAQTSWWSQIAEMSARALDAFARDWGATVRLPEQGYSVDDSRLADLLDPDAGYVRFRVDPRHDRLVILPLRASWQQDGRAQAARALVGEAV